MGRWLTLVAGCCLAPVVSVCAFSHHHSAQRTCPVHARKCVAPGEGTIHIVTGAAGAGFSPINAVAPPWINFVQNQHHAYTRAHVRDNVLQLRLINAKDRTVLDAVDIPSRFTSEQTAAAAAAAAAQPKLMTVDEAEDLIDTHNSESIYVF